MKQSFYQRKKVVSFLTITLLLNLFFSCTNKKEDFPYVTPLSDYMPLAVGKYFIYRLDSTVSSLNAKDLEVHRYLVKDSIDAIIKDGQGRDVYRIRRFITDSLGLGPWTDNATFTVTPVKNNPNGESIEFVDNNFRYIKLKAPIRDGFSWPGNSYINTTTSDYLYLNGWDYTYQDIDVPLTVRGTTYPSTITVLQQPDEGGKENLSDPNVKFDQRNYSIEKYAKGIGLVFKEFIHWTFQRDVIDPSRYYYTEDSYGIKLQLVEHN